MFWIPILRFQALIVSLEVLQKQQTRNCKCLEVFCHSWNQTARRSTWANRTPKAPSKADRIQGQASQTNNSLHRRRISICSVLEYRTGCIGISREIPSSYQEVDLSILFLLFRHSLYRCMDLQILNRKQQHQISEPCSGRTLMLKFQWPWQFMFGQ